MSDPVIRRAVRGVDDVAVAGVFDLWPGHERGSLQRELDGWHEHFVADLEGMVVGYANLTPSGWQMDHYPGTRAMGSNWGFMPDLTVAPLHRRRGIGALLVAAAEDGARIAGAQGLAVNPDGTGDKASLHRFYLRCGFEPALPWPDHDPGGWPYFFKRF